MFTWVLEHWLSHEALVQIGNVLSLRQYSDFFWDALEIICIFHVECHGRGKRPINSLDISLPLRLCMQKH